MFAVGGRFLFPLASQVSVCSGRAVFVCSGRVVFVSACRTGLRRRCRQPQQLPAAARVAPFFKQRSQKRNQF
ncbi:hypothetical protein [Methanimicrococcus hongohii]|uniref:hypothetical protein n=1 Tax=Methanimicrococcus hongohii TaxID=3028295 RepID=UPI00292F8D50|nr:hypothetical protein [Methanimicrococcus sp. Hf6]